MRTIKYIVLHCTATQQSATVENIQRYWRDRLGWKNPGYHYIYTPDGGEHQLLDVSKIANGVRGYNRNSVHLAYIGGLYNDDRTPKQKTAMYSRLLKLWKDHPLAQTIGHRQLDPYKECPRFDVPGWIKNHQIGLTT